MVSESQSIIPARVLAYYKLRYSKATPWSSDAYYDFVMKFLGDVSSKRVLDIGCGYGEMLQRILKNQGKAYGIDIAESATNFVKKAVPQAIVKLASAENMPFDDNFFDIVLCSGVIEHFIDVTVGLAEIRRVLKSKGTLIAIVPNKNWLGQLYRWFGMNYVYGILRITLPNQPIERELSFGQWLALLERNGYAVNWWHPWNIDLTIPLANFISIKADYITSALCYHFIIKATCLT